MDLTSAVVYDTVVITTQGKGKTMNYKTRSLRAGSAVTLVMLALLIGADALGHLRGGAEYRYEISVPFIVTMLALAVVLFAWNAIEYAVKK